MSGKGSSCDYAFYHGCISGNHTKHHQNLLEAERSIRDVFNSHCLHQAPVPTDIFVVIFLSSRINFFLTSQKYIFSDLFSQDPLETSSPCLWKYLPQTHERSALLCFRSTCPKGESCEI